MEQIKERLSIQDVVSGYIKLVRAGKNLKAVCPFHNEKTPSFFVSPERGVYHCFGCGRGGDILSFVQEFEGVDFSGALHVLADRAGVEIIPLDPTVVKERDRLFLLLSEASVYFEQELANHEGARKYLASRTITDETREQFHLGYAPDQWRGLYDTFSGKGYTDDELERVGLIKLSDSGKRYDTFRSRIMFPIYDGVGRPIAFSGRLYEESSKKSSAEAPKYLNSPETSLFNKSKVLYGFERAKPDIRKYDFCIVVEGQIDVLLAHGAGYRNTVAPLGTALTTDHLTRMRQLTRNLLFAFDADAAGLASLKRSAGEALQLDFDVKVALLPSGSDPADVIAGDADEWKKIVKNSMHIVDFLLTTFSDDTKGDRAFKQKVSREVLPFIARITNTIDQAHFVKIVADALSVPETVIYEELSKVEIITTDTADTENNVVDGASLHSRRDMALYRILGIVNWQEELSDPLIDTTSVHSRLKSLVGDTEKVGGLVDVRKEEYAFGAEISFEGKEHLEKHLEELFITLEEDVLHEELESSLGKLKKAESKGDSSLVTKLLSRCQELAQKIEQLKRTLQHTE